MHWTAPTVTTIRGWTRERDFSCFFMAVGLEYWRPALNSFGERATPHD
jgi:hypothetical protein